MSDPMDDLANKIASAMCASRAWPAVFQAGAAQELTRAALAAIEAEGYEIVKGGTYEFKSVIQDILEEDEKTRRVIGDEFTLVPPDGGDVKTHEAVAALRETLENLREAVISQNLHIRVLARERNEAWAALKKEGYALDLGGMRYSYRASKRER